jgi:hypothetical protein
MSPSAVPLAANAEGRPCRAGRLAVVLVWGAWAAMTAALLGYVGAFARDVPWWDDWDLVPVLAGQEPASPAWLWERHNEHRIPIPKLIHLALAAPAGADFRAGAYVNAVGLSAGALALILAARRLRGRTSGADALFPLALLHWGQYDNLIWSFQVQFVCSTALFLVAVALLATSGPRVAPGRGCLVGLCALALPFCGANGAALVPALAVWLAGAALLRRRGARLLAALAALALTAVAVSFLGYARPALHPASPGVGPGLRSALLVLLMADGPAGAVPYGPLLGLFVLLLALLGAVVLARAALAGGVDRLRGLGVVAALGAVVVLGAGVGWSRAGLHVDSPGAITGVTRYVTLMAPLTCCAALAWSLTGSRLMPYLLLGAVAGMLPANMLLGWESARWRADSLDQLTADARRGVPPDQLAATYGPIVHAVDSELLAARLAMLRRAGLGPYRGLPADSPAGEDVRGPWAIDTMNGRE